MRLSKPRSTQLQLGFQAHAGRVLLAAALIGFGVQYARAGDLSDGLPPLPSWIPDGHIVAYIAAFVLIVGGLEILAAWRAFRISFLLGLVLAAAACTHLRLFTAVVLNGPARTGFLEPLALAAACFVLHGLYTRLKPNPILVLGRLIFAFCLILFGVEHFLDPNNIAGLIPTWIPYPFFWTAFTGAGMIAAGLALIVSKADKIASLALTLMFLIWLGALHIPLIVAKPLNDDLWSSALVVLGMAGASLLMAASSPPLMKPRSLLQELIDHQHQQKPH